MPKIDSIDGSSVSEKCSIIGVNTSNACPASGWYVVRDWMSANRHTILPSYVKQFHRQVPHGPGRIQGLGAVRNLYWGETGDVLTPWPLKTFATTQQAVVADALTEVGALWFLSLVNVTADAGHGSPLSDQLNAKHSIDFNYSQPYSVASCIPYLITNISDSNRIAFPALLTNTGPDVHIINRTYKAKLNTFDGYIADVIEHPDYSYSRLLDVPGHDQEYKVKWIELPGHLFNGSSYGVTILTPLTKKRPGQKVLVCNVAAGWGSSLLALETGEAGVGAVESTSSEGEDLEHAPIPISHSNGPEAELMNHDKVFRSTLQVPGKPQVINISVSWAQYLNPHVEDLNKSLFNVLEDAEKPLADSNTAAGILTMLTVNGLSRTGWGSRLQGQVRSVGVNGEGGPDGNYWLKDRGDVFDVDPAESQDWVTLRVKSTLEGYAYNTLTTPPRIAIAVLIAYCLLVLGHVLYSAITGKSPAYSCGRLHIFPTWHRGTDQAAISDTTALEFTINSISVALRSLLTPFFSAGISSNCWDTIAEVTALAVNSTPTVALRNTCAGITELHIFKIPVRVLMLKDEEGEGEHLELVFGTVDEEKTRGKTIQANRTYGTLPNGVKGEGKKNI